MSPGALAAGRLSVGYRGRAVLSGIDLEIRGGEFLGLLGANGAGKSTLLRVLAGLAEPLEGAAMLDGKPAASWKAAERAGRIAYLSQDTAADWAFTVRELVRMGRFARQGWFGLESAADRSAVEAALERTELTGLADRPVTELSGGEARRAFLARALAQEPSILLLDEPIAQLDLKHQLQVLALLKDLASGGLAVVASLHDLNLAGRFADRLAILGGGRLVACGPPDAVLTPATVAEAFGVAMAAPDGRRRGRFGFEFDPL
jgi:iron complex transport system ATP-binding protein